MTEISYPWTEQEGDPPIPYEEIGRLVVAFADLEWVLSMFVSKLVNPSSPVEGAVVLSKMDSVSQVCQLGQRLAKESIPDPALRTQCSDVLGLIQAANLERNKIVHSTWFHGREGDSITVMHASVRDYKSFVIDMEKALKSVRSISADEVASLVERTEMLALQALAGFKALPGWGHQPS